MTTCAGITRTGKRCKLKPLENERYCRFHLSQKTEEPEKPQKNTARHFIHLVTRTRIQLLILVVVFVLTFATSRFLDGIIQIPNSVVVVFFSTVSQSLAALLGFMFAMGIFFMQLVNQERINAYEKYKAEVKELFNLSKDCPARLDLQDSFLEALKSLSYATLADIASFNPPNWEGLETLVNDAFDLCEDSNALNTQEEIFIHRVTSTALSVEESYNRLGFARIGYIVTKVEFKAVPKFVVLLIISLLFLILFGSIDVQDIFPDLRSPMVVTFFMGFVLVVVELLTDLNRSVRTFQEVWPEPPDQFLET